ncbi:MAG: cyclopropane-fatty-acyl-phospholipid synthase family protein [Chromatiales bacterium]|jgi:cyclopropane-fatty-acyl-phospholipid synthase
MSALLSKQFERLGRRTAVPFRVEFADGTAYRNRADEPVFTLRFRSGRAQWKTLLFGHLGILESYFDGDVDVEGDVARVFRAGMDSGFNERVSPLVRVRNRWHELRYSNRSRRQAKANAVFHYALGTDFYRLWLDEQAMMYTCAYWKEGTETLEEAQLNKNDHVCRKLRLEPGESLVDIGCGWGGLMFHARAHYGVDATGYNATSEQVGALRAEIRRRGLEPGLRVQEADFRDIDEQYDKAASIGVLEHAGRDQLGESVQALAACLKPGGLGVLHFIGHVEHRDTEFWIRKHIFPGGWIPSLSRTLDAMAANGLEVLDVENLRRHYAPTLDAWAERFDARWEAIHALDPERFDERFRRKWRTYLYACAEMFRSPNSRTHLFQITFSKGNVGSDYPMSRAYLYAGAASPPKRTGWQGD